MKIEIIIILFLLYSSNVFAEKPLSMKDALDSYSEGMKILELAQPSDLIVPGYRQRLDAGYASHGRDRDILFEKAINYFKQAVLFDPHFSKAYNRMGNAFLSWGKKDQALNAFRKAGEADSRYPWGHKNRGDIFLKDKVYKEAISAYTVFLEINPKYGRAEVLYKLGKIYTTLGQKNDAQLAFQHAIKVSAPLEIWRSLAETEIQKYKSSKERK